MVPGILIFFLYVRISVVVRLPLVGKALLFRKILESSTFCSTSQAPRSRWQNVLSVTVDLGRQPKSVKRSNPSGFVILGDISP